MLKVLVVEDEDMIRKGLIHTMDWTAMDCTIIAEARNGKEGLEKIEIYKPDIVITDIIMPKMTGIEMLEIAKEKVGFKSIILTSYSEFEYAQKAINLKVSDYLLKPVDEEELFKVLRRLKQEIEEKHRVNNIIEKVKDKSELQLLDISIYSEHEKRYNQYVLQAIQKIKIHYQDKISLEGVANELGVSPSYLCRKFKEETSQTFLDMLNKYRIQKAIELLEHGNYKVYEISDLTGFSEYKHFCTVFKKYTNMAPTEFVRNASLIIHKAERKDKG